MIERIPARALVPGAPASLPALRFFQRHLDAPSVRIAVVGDVGFSGAVRVRADRDGLDAPLRPVAPMLSEADIVFGNLENTLLDDPDPGLLFASPSGVAGALARAGFNVLSLANNHALDYGQEGLASTMAALGGQGIDRLGAGETFAEARAPLVFEQGTLRIGWLGCGRTLVEQDGGGVACYWEYDPPALVEAVRALRPQVDILIVSVHIGYMFVEYPHPRHRRLALECAEAGADIVIGHHAHVLQGVEVVENAVVCHGLGNFLFDWSEGLVRANTVRRKQQEGALFVFTVARGGIVSAGAIPTRIDDGGVVHPAVGRRGEAIVARLERLSRQLTGDYRWRFRQQRFARTSLQAVRMLRYHVQQRDWSSVAGMARKSGTALLQMFPLRGSNEG